LYAYINFLTTFYFYHSSNLDSKKRDFKSFFNLKIHFEKQKNTIASTSNRIFLFFKMNFQFEKRFEISFFESRFDE